MPCSWVHREFSAILEAFSLFLSIAEMWFTTAFAHHVNGRLGMEDQISQAQPDQLLIRAARQHRPDEASHGPAIRLGNSGQERLIRRESPRD
jgi:hypothetical protein